MTLGSVFYLRERVKVRQTLLEDVYFGHRHSLGPPSDSSIKLYYDPECEGIRKTRLHVPDRQDCHHLLPTLTTP